MKTPAERLADKRILIIEDEYFMADDLRRALTRAAVRVVGPVQTLDQGLELAKTEPLDAALLDINLDGVMSYPVADVLMERRIPFGMASGYDHWSIPEQYRGVARLLKPYTLNQAVRLLADLAAPPAGAGQTQGTPK
ncbi:MAG TPA: response regulator [Sphingomonas sp.]|jgi:DNA-binding NtrC family response regulator|uniref:response regulator n=1 Tax=Sphingomonas sp. TaxID=28214 RepID=UPI002ED90B8F